MKRPISLAIVGIGKIAVDQHLPSVAQEPAFSLDALVSRRGVGHGDVPVFADLADMLAKRPDIEAVSFCTPPRGRHAAVAAALDAGRHVLVEKPPTATLAELHDLENRARLNGRVLFTSWHCQFNPSVGHVRDVLLREGVSSVELTWKEDVRRWHPGQEWIWEPGGFGVFDPGMNALSILTAVLPFPVFVTEARHEVPANRQMPIAARLVFGNAHDIPVSADFDWRAGEAETWDVAIETRTGQRLLISRGGGELRVNGAVIYEGRKKEYPAIYRRFAELIRAGHSDIDAAPLRLVADAFLLGARDIVEPFNW